MRAWICLILATLPAAAEDSKEMRGAEVYRTNCGVVYCHGPDGKPGRAPGLAGRTFQTAAIVAIVSRGIPNTSMPAFGERLKAEQIEAVAAYIVSLGAKEGTPAQAGPKPTAMPPEIERGQSLFFDSARVGNCGSCHEIGGRGDPVSLGLVDLKGARSGNLRAIATPDVVTVHPNGEDPFPAVTMEKTAAKVRVYDLSARLPVLRTFAISNVSVESGSAWRHAAATSLYTDSELQAITDYLRWVAAHM